MGVRSRLRYQIWHVGFAFTMLACALRWWRKPWQSVERFGAANSEDPRSNMSLRTALEVAWICWR